MRIFGTYKTKNRKRKQWAPGRRPAVPPVRLWAVLGLIVVAMLFGPNLLKGGGASGEEPSTVFSLKAPRFDPGQVAANLQKKVKAIRIDRFFSSRRSPLTGMGEAFVDAERDTGVSAELVAAITLVESSCATDGALSVTNYNAWGMKGPQPALGIEARGGYCCWSDWPSAIHGAARFILNYWGPARSAGELKGYCCGSGTWAGAVEGARQTMI